MEAGTFTLIDDGRAVEIAARIEGDRVRLSAESLREAIGWELEGGVLCCDAICFPVPPAVSLESADGIDLAALAAVLDRPLAVDVAEGAAFLGASARERADALASLQAPDFTLPDLDGRPHSLSEQRRRKVLLVAWASW